MYLEADQLESLQSNLAVFLGATLSPHQIIYVMRALEFCTQEQPFERYYGTYGVEKLDEAINALITLRRTSKI